VKRLAGAILFAGAVVLGAGEAGALPSELQDLVKAPRPAGCSHYRFLFWDFYRAELWSDAEELPGDAFGLSLTYRTDFSRDELVESSVEEMSRISGLPEYTFAEARTEMQEAFRDVAPGDRITTWRAGPGELRLFVNGQETGALTREVDLFLAIWLGEKTRHPEGRQELLAGRCDG
jgi:hypothetical protein